MVKTVRGINIIHGIEADIFVQIEKVFNNIAERYSLKKLYLPLIEYESSFNNKNVGEASDIVMKQLFNFSDKKQRKLALIPEGTMSVHIFIHNNKIINSTNFREEKKYYYFSPFFRYERPQKGRKRQFYQIGVEYINVQSYLRVIEIIQSIIDFLLKIKLNNYVLYINNIGSFNERKEYNLAFKKVIFTHLDKLCHDCKKRFNLNTLRILDCKKDKLILDTISIPVISSFVKNDKEWNNILKILDIMKIKYTIDNNLVRGLNYYENFVFEFKIDDCTIAAGGLYKILFSNNNINLLNCGFAMGIDRITEYVMKYYNNVPLINGNNRQYVEIISNSETNNYTGYLLSMFLRKNDFSVVNRYNILNNKFNITNHKHNSTYHYIFWNEDNSKEIKIITFKDKEKHKVNIRSSNFNKLFIDYANKFNK